MDRSLRLTQASPVITKKGSKPEILSRIAQTTAALTRLKPVWIDKSISLSSKVRLMRSLLTSIFLYACYHVTNEEVRAKIQQAIAPYDLPTIVKRRKLQWYGHVSRSSGLAKTILQGTMKGGIRHGGQRKRWEDNIRRMDRPGVRQVPEASGEQGKIEKIGCKIICDAPTTLAVTG